MLWQCVNRERWLVYQRAWKDFYKANVEFFEDLGSPGGAAKLGPQDFDAALLASVPPQEHEH